MDVCTVVCNMTFLNITSNIRVSMTHYIDKKHAFLLLSETIKYQTGYRLFSMTIVFLCCSFKVQHIKIGHMLVFIAKYL